LKKGLAAPKSCQAFLVNCGFAENDIACSAANGDAGFFCFVEMNDSAGAEFAA
jgi:hypothetical protein